MTAKQFIIQDIKLVDFPEEVDVQNGIKIYGETSWENQLAVLSHNTLVLAGAGTGKCIIMIALVMNKTRKKYYILSGNFWSEKKVIKKRR